MSFNFSNRNVLLITGVVLSAIIFFIDIQTPLGVVDGISYIAIITLTIWLDDKRYTLGAALFTILLTILGFLFSPQGEPLPIVITNRLLTIGTIAVTTILILKYKKSVLVIKDQQAEMHQLNINLKKHNLQLEKKAKERMMILEEAVNELNKTKEDLTSALAEEKELNDLKSRFVSMASHEFRTPLATILSSLSLLRKYGEQNEREKQIKHINKIKVSVNNLTDIINDVLTISKIEEGKVPVASEVLNIRTLTQEIVREMQGITKENQEIIYVHSGIEEISSYSKILKHILLNLLSNAIKFSPEGKPIEIITNIINGNVSIRVKDSGIGISEEDQKHLFERFFRAQNATNIQGTGLGLNIVAKYVEFIKGEITFKSRLNEGTTFTITFSANPDIESLLPSKRHRT